VDPVPNYIRAREIKIAGSIDKASADQLTDPFSVKGTSQYFDGLGRPIQVVGRQASPSGNDMISSQVYDSFGREVLRYLPYTAPSADGNYRGDPVSEQHDFNAVQFPTEQFYYDRTDYESSPLNRTVNTFAPGNSWIGSSRGVNSQYLLNDISEEVQMWSIDLTTGGLLISAGPYPSGRLYKNITTDEANHQVIEYKNKDGQVILKKAQAVPSPGVSHSGWACTYYVYDDVGNLIVVLSPEAVKIMLGQ
jgi:hypothetical protein